MDDHSWFLRKHRSTAQDEHSLYNKDFDEFFQGSATVWDVDSLFNTQAYSLLIKMDSAACLTLSLPE